MKIVFMGTPMFARKSLEQLYMQEHEIIAVFTGDDKPRNRMKVSVSPVKELALQHNITVLHDSDLRAETIRNLNCDIIIVVAYGRLLPKEILDIPPLGCINIHASLLPKYRGAAPIQHAILNGEKETGVTSQYMAEKMDAGDIVLTASTSIGSEETAEDLFDRLGDIGAKLLIDTIQAIVQGTAPRIPQNHAEATFAPMLKKEMAPIDFNAAAFDIKCKVRALIPWPVATMELNGKTVKVYAVETTDNRTGERPGTVLSVVKNGIEIACNDGTVIITQLQPPSGRIMPAADYARGNPVT